ncbi:YlxM family DNA-binding protein [Gottschalkiaceae bacterium SANA]|nr:YlxM family DNA-binding protein [Gottschalkiaceae bacterium SANA]
MNIEDLALHNDFYGKLLSERQQEVVHMICEEDFSLTESGENLGITKQAVSEVLRRSTKKLQSFEDKLGMIQRFQKVVSQLQAIDQELGRMDEVLNKDQHNKIQDMRQQIQNMMKQF